MTGLKNWQYVLCDHPFFRSAPRNTLWLTVVMLMRHMAFELGSV